MKRRDFLKAAAGMSVMAVCPVPGNVKSLKDHGKAVKLSPGSQTNVYLSGVVKGSSANAIKAAVRESAKAATDFSWLSKGDNVFIKPVVNSGRAYPSTTSPLAIAAMVELLKEKGAGRVIVGDMSGIEYVRFTPTSLSGSSRKLMESCGLARYVQASGAQMHFFEEAGWKAFYEDTPASGCNWKRPIMMPNILKEVQHIILMPRCSRHLLTGSTLGMKAAVGYWRHDTRLEYHHDASTILEKTAEANSVETLRKKQRLVITAADKILTTFGPDKGYVSKPDNGIIIASQSVVAHDMVSLAWLLLNRLSIPEDQKNDFIDTSKIVPRVANRVVVNWLGGVVPAITAQALIKNDLKTIWDDRVITHACNIFGGVPAINLVASNKALFEDLRKNLSQMIALPA